MEGRILGLIRRAVEAETATSNSALGDYLTLFDIRGGEEGA